MLNKIVYVFRIIAICLIIFLLVAYILKWNFGKQVFLATAFFMLVYVLLSMLLVITKFKHIQRPPAKSGQGMPEIPDNPPEAVKPDDKTNNP